MTLHVGHMSTDNGNELRSWLTAIIARSGTNLTQVAKQAGVSHTTLSRALDPNQRPPNFRADTISKLSKLSGIPAPAEIAAAVAAGRGDAELEPLLSGEQPGGLFLKQNQSLWKIGPSFSTTPGYRPGDVLLVDTSLQPVDGDDVLASLYDQDSATTETVLRTYRRSWLFGGPTPCRRWSTAAAAGSPAW